MKKLILLIFLIMILSLQTFSKGVKKGKMFAKINTNRGEINLVLFPEKSPLTVANFINLSQRKFYDGVIFHRVIEDFMAQGGDPTGTGMGGPGYKFEDETYNGLTFSKAGKLAMANAGPNTNGSQFFITTVPTEWLNGKHTIFGEVVSKGDLSVVEILTNGVIIENITISGEGIEELLEKYKERIEQWNSWLSLAGY